MINLALAYSIDMKKKIPVLRKKGLFFASTMCYSIVKKYRNSSVVFLLATPLCIKYNAVEGIAMVQFRNLREAQRLLFDLKLTQCQSGLFVPVSFDEFGCC